MASYIVTALFTVTLFWLWKEVMTWRRNVEVAKASGFPYRISLISGIPGYLWMAIHPLFLGTLDRFTPSRKWLWPKLFHVHRSWFYAEEMREALGEVYLTISPRQIFMSCSNPETIVQLTTRRSDFPKPVEIYAIVDIFGTSVLTTEGEEWKRHRKIVAPAFSEKSNALVWKESLEQAHDMLRVLSELEGNTPEDIKVQDTAPYTATMALHVICAAGFGVRQLWNGEDESRLGTRVVPGFNTAKLNGSHTLTFKESLTSLLHGVMWLAIFPVSLLKRSPFELHKKLLRAYFECGDYFKELCEWKLQQVKLGEMSEKGTMDIMRPLVRASERSPEDSKGQFLTKQEVVADCFITLFAGHETSANILHLCLLFLAINLDVQTQLQEDIDVIVGSRPSSEWTYETDLARLWNSTVGASINETLRLMPPVIDVPKVVRSNPQPLGFDGKTCMVPANTMIHISCVGVQRNPRYWPHAPSKLSDKQHDLDDWVPARWHSSLGKSAASTARDSENKDEDILENTTTFDTHSSLFVPAKGIFIPFSEGARACPGKRFAQVEITAILAVIFKYYSLELDVREWASDAQIHNMVKEDRRTVYEKGMSKARNLIAASQSEIFLQMRGNYPVRFVKRGKESYR